MLVDTDPTAWRSSMEHACTDGFTWLDLLTVVDRNPRGGWEMIAHVVRLADGARRWIRSVVADPMVDSVVDLYPAAAWHEREAWEMFGIDFMGGAASQVLLLVSPSPAHPLRKSVPLTARVTRPWPGAEEAHEDSRRRSASRRRARPPGVPEAWFTQAAGQTQVPARADRPDVDRPDVDRPDVDRSDID